MKVIVLTSDNYLNALRPFAWLFNKYWHERNNQEVIVAGFRPPPFDLPSNFTFFSIGDQTNYPVTKWSNALIKVMSHFPQEKVFCLMLEDYWITEPVWTDEVYMLERYMKQFGYVLKMDLFTDRRYANGVTDYAMCGHIPLIKSAFDSPYHMSLMCGLWNRNQLLNILIPDESPWDIEIVGTSRLAEKKDDVLVLGTKSWTDNPDTCPVRHTLAHRRGDPSELLLSDIHPEDLRILKEISFLAEN